MISCQNPKSINKHLLVDAESQNTNVKTVNGSLNNIKVSRKRSQQVEE
jgi:hypothetical protein